MKKSAFLLILLLVPSSGWAQQRSALESGQDDLFRLEKHHSLLESLLNEHSQRIIRLKAQNVSVRRDFQLKAAMRDSQALAGKLTQLRSEIREMTQSLIRKYQKAIDETKEFATRKKLSQQLKLLQFKLAPPKTRILTGGSISPDDSPEDLIEKADILEDSEEKILRRIRQVETRIASLEHRVKLKRHGTALEDNPFNEASPRRTGQVRQTTLTGVAKADPTPAPPDQPDRQDPVEGSKSNDPSADNANSSPSEDKWSYGPPSTDMREDDADSAPTERPGTGSGTWTPMPEAPSSGTTEGVIISIQDVMDPSLLLEITGPLKNSKNLLGRLAALKKAQQQLHRVANHLNSQAKQLRNQAHTLQQKK